MPMIGAWRIPPRFKRSEKRCSRAGSKLLVRPLAFGYNLGSLQGEGVKGAILGSVGGQSQRVILASM